MTFLRIQIYCFVFGLVLCSFEKEYRVLLYHCFWGLQCNCASFALIKGESHQHSVFQLLEKHRPAYGRLLIRILFSYTRIMHQDIWTIMQKSCLSITLPPECVIKMLLECCTLMVSCSQNPTNIILESHLCVTIFKGIDFFLIAFLNSFLGSMRFLYSLITESLLKIILF